MKAKGWKQILGFTFVQNVKSKSFIASTVIIAIVFALIAVAINILPKIIGGESFQNLFSGKDYTAVKTLYVCDETGFENPVDFTALADNSPAIVNVDAADFAAKGDEITKSTEAVALLHIIKSDEAYELQLFRPENEELVDGSACDSLSALLSAQFKNAMLMNYGVSADDLALVQLNVNTSVSVFTEDVTDPESFKMVVSMLLPMFSAIIFFSFIISYSQLIAQSVATEKTSRVMELLLTSVRPLSVIVGKVLAMLLVCIFQFLVLGIVAGAAFFISAPFGFIPDMIASGGQAISEGAAAAAGNAAASADFGVIFNEIGAQVSNAIPGIDPLSIILIIITFVLGFLFFALLAGLCGASVSRAEDLATAIQPLVFISLIGFFISYFPVMSNIGEETIEPSGLMIAARFIPISSPFSLPAGILLGQMSPLESCLSVAFLGVCVVLTALLVSKVYHHIVLYSGNPLKFTQLLKFAKKEK